MRIMRRRTTGHRVDDDRYKEPLPAPRASDGGAVARYAYLLPALAIVGTFALFPIAYSFYPSLESWDFIRRTPLFVGLGNYRRL